ncbi:hypothetical protein ACFFLM_22915 [Deinococcus oregonensis]|uniref:Uncharacterized protein n=1 Tax=Deinococcus oregonensis TaxID=1805970 RepID=A0ABV6B4X7_9DEIO
MSSKNAATKLLHAVMERFFATLELELDTAQGNHADTRHLIFE